MSSRDFFESIIQDSINLINEEFKKLRLNLISRDEVLLFFEDDYFGINVSIEMRESKKRILNNRMVKLAYRISEDYSIAGYTIIVE